MKKALASLLLGAALAVAAPSVSAAGEIRLQKVNSLVRTTHGLSQQGLVFEANVANLAFAKQVFAHVRNGSGVWSDVALSYNRPAEAGREIWRTSYTLPVGTTYDVQFALKYVVNGETYWDNNGGQNYSIARDSGSILGAGLNVYNDYYGPSYNLGPNGQTYYGGVTLRNLAPTKVVRVHFSTDNWATPAQIVNASFNTSPPSYSNAPNPNQYGFEEWNFQLPVGNASSVQYAIEYIVAGQTYWDNNYTQNYTVNFIRQ